MKYILVLLSILMLGGCMVVITPEAEYPQKVCVDATATHFINCTTGKLIADDAYKR